jgi:hypothetical protein
MNNKFGKSNFFSYDTDCIENNASNNSLLPQERLHQIVPSQWYVDTEANPQTHSSNNYYIVAFIRFRGKVLSRPRDSVTIKNWGLDW